MKDFKEILEQAKAEDLQIKKDRAIIDQMVIDRKNELMILLFKFREYLKDNAEKLKGKKLKMADGSKSKFFSSFLEQWPEMQEINKLFITSWFRFSRDQFEVKLSNHIWHKEALKRDQTNVTVERSIYSLIYIDSEGKPREREEDETLYQYDTRIYTLSDLQQSRELIKLNQIKIKELQNQISQADYLIPSELQERRY